jgi:hypothetical protein
MVFAEQFTTGVEAALSSLAGKHIAIDGKALRGYAGKPVHLISAVVSEAQLILGQAAVDVKSNEITAIPTLLELLDIQGATVTIVMRWVAKKPLPGALWRAVRTLLKP